MAPINEQRAIDEARRRAAAAALARPAVTPVVVAEDDPPLPTTPVRLEAHLDAGSDDNHRVPPHAVRVAQAEPPRDQAIANLNQPLPYCFQDQCEIQETRDRTNQTLQSVYIRVRGQLLWYQNGVTSGQQISTYTSKVGRFYYPNRAGNLRVLALDMAEALASPQLTSNFLNEWFLSVDLYVNGNNWILPYGGYANMMMANQEVRSAMEELSRDTRRPELQRIALRILDNYLPLKPVRGWEEIPNRHRYEFGLPSQDAGRRRRRRGSRQPRQMPAEQIPGQGPKKPLRRVGPPPRYMAERVEKLKTESDQALADNLRLQLRRSDLAPKPFRVPVGDPPLFISASFGVNRVGSAPTVSGTTTATPDVVIATVAGVQGPTYLPMIRFNRIQRALVDKPEAQVFLGPPAGSTVRSRKKIRLHFLPDQVSYQTVVRDNYSDDGKRNYPKVIGHVALPLMGPERGYVDSGTYRLVKDPFYRPPYLDELSANQILGHAPVRVQKETGGLALLMEADPSDREVIDDLEDVVGFEYEVVETTQGDAAREIDNDSRVIYLKVDYEANPDLQLFVTELKKSKADPLVKLNLLRRWVAENISYTYTQTVGELYADFYKNFDHEDSQVSDANAWQLHNIVNFALSQRVGVCGIHEVIFGTLVRDIFGLPTRRVEGYMTMDGKVSTQNTHAWTEVFVPDYGWAIFDSTPQRR